MKKMGKRPGTPNSAIGGFNQQQPNTPAQEEIDLLVSCFNAKKYVEAAARARMFTARHPRHGFGWKALGATLTRMGRITEAIEPMQKAVMLMPDDAESHFNLGVLLKAVARIDEAISSYSRAIELQPNSADAHYNLGNALHESQRLKEAIASYRRALSANPNFVLALSNLLFLNNYLRDEPQQVMYEEARRYGQLVAQHAKPFNNWANTPDPARCLRVGMVSGDLREHPVGYFLVGVLEALSTEAIGRMELFAYLSHPCDDALSARIKACCGGWTLATHLSDEQLALKMRDDGIDILIDLAGHSEHNRLPVFAWRPAPLQVSWLGYFATTGVAEIDYIIADPVTLAKTEECYFTEEVWRLPETRLCFSRPNVDVSVSPLPAVDNAYVTFGCFNNIAKVNASVVTIWARILCLLPRSRLFLKSGRLDDSNLRRQIEEQFAAHGVGPEQLIMEGASSRADYFSAYHKVDISLDPFPFPGGTTTVESLWMGVPVLTLLGQHFLARQGVGLLTNAGLAEWIADSPDDYVELAVSQAGNLNYLATLRQGLRQKILATPLFDEIRFSRNFETALREIWTKWCHKDRDQAADA